MKHLADKLSRYQRAFGFVSGHGEGWALYAERLMAELGYLDDPAWEMGMLSAQAMRAVRVIVDIGMHLELPSPEHDGGGPSGNSWEHILRDGKTILFNWLSWDAHVIACSVVPPGPCSPKAINTRADFVGTGKYSIGAGGRSEDGNMVAYIIDHNEGSCNKGTRDEYFITVRKGLVIGEGEVARVILE